MKILFTFLLIFLSFGAKAQLYISGTNDTIPTLYIGDSAHVYVEGNVIIEGKNTKGDKFIQVDGQLYVAGNWKDSTGAPIYTYSLDSIPNKNNTVFLDYNNQFIEGYDTLGNLDTSSKTYFNNLTLSDTLSAIGVKTVSGADIHIDGILNLNNQYLNTQNKIVHVDNPNINAIVLNNNNFNNDTTGGMVISSDSGRLLRVVNTTSPYLFPVGSLVSLGQAYSLFRPAEIIPGNNATKEFAVSLAARDGFYDAGTSLDQQGSPWHSLAGIDHQYYFKINLISDLGTNDTDQIRLYHDLSNNSDANSYPNWSNCGNIPSEDFPQTITIAQYQNNVWSDVCHGNSLFIDTSNICGSSLIIDPNGDFCNNTIINTPYLNYTTTVAYQVPGRYYGLNNTDEDYAIAGLFFTVDGGNGSCDGNCATLPLNLISFTGWNVNNQVENELQWITATEENTDYFIVEKSIDGNNFNQIGNNVPAAGFSNTQRTYNLFDNEPNIGNNYYRVKEVFYNGNYSYTNVIDIPYNKQITIANIYPNPVTNNLNISFETSNLGIVYTKVYDVFGRLVIDGFASVNQGNNLFEINTSELSAGSYFIRLIDSKGFSDTQKFIKVY